MSNLNPIRKKIHQIKDLSPQLTELVNCEEELQKDIKNKHETQVVNVKVAYIRPEFENLKDWVKNSNNIYIGRQGIVFIKQDSKRVRFPKKASIWANPFKICKGVTRSDVLKKYEKYIREKILNEPNKYCIESLRGKTLGCWCHPKGCHGDILKKLLDEKKSGHFKCQTG